MPTTDPVAWTGPAKKLVTLGVMSKIIKECKGIHLSEELYQLTTSFPDEMRERIRNPRPLAEQMNSLHLSSSSLEQDDYQNLSDRWATANTTMAVVIRGFHKWLPQHRQRTCVVVDCFLLSWADVTHSANYIIKQFPETLLSMPELYNLEIIMCNFLPGLGGGSDSIGHFNVSLILRCDCNWLLC